MKKLMIVAAAAAISAGASAATLDAQAYDVTLTVKSTACRDIKYTKTIASLEGYDYKDVKGDKVTTRKQASTKIVGVIWGCDCETIADPQWRLYQGTQFKTVGGYLFWNPKAEEVFNIFTTTFGWALFNRIDDGEKVEGVWALSNNDINNVVGFVGAGFGKLKETGDCRVYVTSMSGNFAGFILGGSAANGCMLCGGNGTCQTWDVCACLGVVYDKTLSAAYGTWKIKYNSKVSKNLRRTGLITESYKFKSSSGDAATLLAKVEYAASHDFFGAEDDFEGEAYGETIEKGTVGAAAYGTITADGDIVEGEEPETYDGDNPLVTAILELAEADKDAS